MHRKESAVSCLCRTLTHHAHTPQGNHFLHAFFIRGPAFRRASLMTRFRSLAQKSDSDFFDRVVGASSAPGCHSPELSPGSRVPTAKRTWFHCDPRDEPVSAPPSETLQAEYVRSGVCNPVKTAWSSQRIKRETCIERGCVGFYAPQKPTYNGQNTAGRKTSIAELLEIQNVSSLHGLR
jgi:hypothetical protein